MEQIMEVVMPAVLQLAGTVLMVGAGILGYQVKKLYNNYIDTQTKKDVVETTVQYVEQVFTDIHGPEKLDKAIKRASELLEEQGVTVSTKELETLIESAVNGFNSGYAWEKSEVRDTSEGE